MKKTTLTIWFIALFAFYIAYEKLTASQTAVLVSPNQNQASAATSESAPNTSSAPPPNPIASNPGTTQGSASTQKSVPQQIPAPAPKSVGMYKDGTYIGSSANAYYGNVQVQAIVTGGKLTNVQFLDYPQSHSTSVYINQQVMPYLTQEAIQAQNANVNIISGATFTSQAFVQSLSSALAQAINS